MLDCYRKERVLITAKTYPVPSRTHTETVCTAGVTSDGKWIRLYPIRFRSLQENQKYNLFTWIDVEVKKNPRDKRPESHSAIDDSIKIINKLDSKKNLNERKSVLLPLVKRSLEEINREEDMYGTSLAIFKPKTILGINIVEQEEDWTPAELDKLSQISIFDDPDDVVLLKKVPIAFKFRFYCDDKECKGHELQIFNWDYNWAYFTYLRQYRKKEIAIQKLKEKWMSYFDEDHDGYLIVGTMHQYHTFIIIGVFSFKKEGELSVQTSLI